MTAEKTQNTWSGKAKLVKSQRTKNGNGGYVQRSAEIRISPKVLDELGIPFPEIVEGQTYRQETDDIVIHLGGNGTNISANRESHPEPQNNGGKITKEVKDGVQALLDLFGAVRESDVQLVVGKVKAIDGFEGKVRKLMEMMKD